MLDGCTLPLFRMFFPSGHGRTTVTPVLKLGENDVEKTMFMIRDLNVELRPAQPGNSLAALAQFIELIVGPDV